MTKARARDAPTQAAMISSQYHVCLSVRTMSALILAMFFSIVFLFINLEHLANHPTQAEKDN
jgi:hypothetical protein